MFIREQHSSQTTFITNHIHCRPVHCSARP